MEAIPFIFFIMITYKYSLIEDIKSHFSILSDFKLLKENKIVIFYFNPIETIKLWFKRPIVSYQADKDITCYWVSGGTWGSYYLPNKIHICPRKASKKFIKNVIKHEITHLEHEHEVRGMSHQEKEAHIENKEHGLNSK